MDIDKHEKICRVYWDIHSRVQDDPEYAWMRAELEKLEPRYETILKALDAESQKVMERYILLRESMGSRMLEWACGELLFPER